MEKVFSFKNENGIFCNGDKVIAECMDAGKRVNYVGELTGYSDKYCEINHSVVVHISFVKHNS